LLAVVVDYSRWTASSWTGEECLEFFYERSSPEPVRGPAARALEDFEVLRPLAARAARAVFPEEEQDDPQGDEVDPRAVDRPTALQTGERTWARPDRPVALSSGQQAWMDRLATGDIGGLEVDPSAYIDMRAGEAAPKSVMNQGTRLCALKLSV